MLNWACELWYVPDILSDVQGIAFRLTCLSSKTLQNNINLSPTLSKCVHRHEKQNSKTQTDMHKLTSSELCFTSLQCFIKSASRSPVIRENKNLCSTWPQCFTWLCLTSTVGFISFGLYLVSNKTCKNKTPVSPFQKIEIRLHIPLSNLTGDVRRRAKKSSTCHANFLWKFMHMQVKNFHLVVMHTHAIMVLSCQHIQQPKWLLRVLCYTCLFVSNWHHTCQRACRIHTSQIALWASCKNRLKHYKKSKPFLLVIHLELAYQFGIETLQHQIANRTVSTHV